MSHISVFLSVDGGGTKLAVVLFDDAMNVLSDANAASVNTNFETMDVVERHMRDSLSRCLSPWLAVHPDEMPQVAYVTIVGPMTLFMRILHEFAPDCALIPIKEGMMHCLSGSLSQSGIVALAGTGSGVALCADGALQTHLGGWGSLVGDEGSGYAIGRDGIAAAIRAHDGWGESTKVTELLMDHYQMKTLHELIPLIYRAENPRLVVASACPVVAKAAMLGDPVALAIYDKAASAMAAQIEGLFRKTSCSPDAHEVTACGGAWRNCTCFFESFQKSLQLMYPGIRVRRARFRVEVGGAVFHLLQENPARTPQELERLLLPGFAGYIEGGFNHDQPAILSNPA